MASIKIPTPLRAYTGGNAVVQVSGNTVGDILSNLLEQHPDLRQHIYEGDDLRSFVNVFLGEDNTRDPDGMATTVSEDAQLRIIPSIAGGAVPVTTLDPAEITLSKDEVMRYSRHLIMPEVGMMR